MKTTIIITLTALIVLTSTAQAQYILNIPMEQGQGGISGSLPGGSINFKSKIPPKPIENWQPAVAIYSNWANTGVPYDCNWTPDSSTILIGDSINQTATSCKQDQNRTKQDQEQEATTLVYRNVGLPVSEIKTSNIAATGSNSLRTTTGTANCLYLNVRLQESYWFSGYNGSYVVYVRGKMITSGNGYGMSSVYIGGKIYNRGTTVKYLSNGYPMYEVCR